MSVSASLNSIPPLHFSQQNRAQKSLNKSMMSVSATPNSISLLFSNPHPTQLHSLKHHYPQQNRAQKSIMSVSATSLPTTTISLLFSNPHPTQLQSLKHHYPQQNRAQKSISPPIMSVSATPKSIPPFSNPHPTQLHRKNNRPRCAILNPNFSNPSESLSLNRPDPLTKPIQGTEPPALATRTGKITVVGVGNVGMAIAQTILTQDLTDDLALLDIQPDKLRGEMLDLQHAAAFLPRTKITADTDYAVTAGSDLCVITAGARQRQGESRLDLLHRNLALFQSIVPQLVQHSPEALLMVVSNPVDVLSYITWKLSGLPPNRVLGSGTNLDSSRLRFSIAERLNVNAQDVQALIVGEHGDSSVALWSTAAVGGVPLLSFLQRSQGDSSFPLDVLHQGVIDGAYEVIRLKGYTSWAVGYSAASLGRSLLRNQRRIHPVSVLAKGFHGIEEEVFLSLPALLGRGGVLGVAEIPLTRHENDRLLCSANTIFQVQKQLAI